MIRASLPDQTWTFTPPGLRVYCVDGAEGPLAVYDGNNDDAWLSTRNPVNLRKWA